MRTTLKSTRARSSAQGGPAAPSGSGNGATNGHQPRVGPLSKLMHYDARQRRQLKTLGKGLLWLVLAALVASGGLAGGVWLFLEDSVDALRPKSQDVVVAKKELVAAAEDPTAPVTALVIGYDARQGPNGFSRARSDTVMLLRADPNRETMTVLSFPRDLAVDHPGCKNRAAWSDKLNEAYLYCGAVGTLRSVQALTGLDINYLITVNFAAFKQMVAKAGGVYIDLERRYFNDQTGPGGYAAIDLHPGYQKLSGQQALDYARYRYGDNDLFRNLRQQVFLKAFKQQVSSTISVTSFPGFVSALSGNVEVQQGGNKDIDSNVVLRYARFLFELGDGGFYQIKVDQQDINEDRSTGQLFLAEETIESAIAEFQNPDAEAPDKAADVAVGNRLAAPKPGNTTIQVFNGNAVEGSAADAAERLRQRKYAAESIGDATSSNYFDTVVQYNPGFRRSKAAARRVAVLFDGVVEAPAEGDGFDTMLRVIVGKTYHNSIAPGASDQTPDKAAPETFNTFDEVAPLVAEAAERLDLAAYVPGLKSSASLLAPQEPVRAYKLGEHQAISIQYVVNQFKYWGFMQTTWLDAPILREPSTERDYKGRRYKLYFSGPRLQMVAFEENNMALWVRNTLDQHLTNETMLELAHGLRLPAGATVADSP